LAQVRSKKTAKKKPAEKTAAKKIGKKKAASKKAVSGTNPEALHAAIREYALGLPEAYEDHPWGESVAKVNKKVFVFLGHPEWHAKHGFGFGVKLPSSGPIALSLPFTEPSGYNLGKSGWVSVSLRPGELPPLGMLKSWVDESYRAIAPKKLAARLVGGEG
jgi:predicted DNA-binding protein (MmcQ/YjbR family)